MQYTLITGATGGIGSCFAEECARRGDNLILTGRSTEKLEELKTRLSRDRSCGEIVIFACDLTDEKQREELFGFVGDRKISLLVNVAGADIQKPFAEYTREKLAFQIRINFEAAVCCTSFALSDRAQRLHVINISSMCGLYPMPNFAVYAAAKGALTSFSRAVNGELRRSGVTVTAVLPGSVYTRKDVCEYIDGLGAWGKFAAVYPPAVVRAAFRASEKGKDFVIVGAANKIVAAFSRLVPMKLRLRFIARKWANSRKDAF